MYNLNGYFFFIAFTGERNCKEFVERKLERGRESRKRSEYNNYIS